MLEMSLNLLKGWLARLCRRRYQPMGKYRQKPDVGSGDEVTETLLEIMPLARKAFNDVVNRSDLLDAVNAEREERLERQSEVQVLEA